MSNAFPSPLTGAWLKFSRRKRLIVSRAGARYPHALLSGEVRTFELVP